MHLPKLFVNAELGHGTAGAARDFCSAWPNQTSITVHAKHYVPEDAPHEIGAALAGFMKKIARIILFSRLRRARRRAARAEFFSRT